jgi:uncharacterized Zn-binding protein involved in type VI secretion
MSGEIIRQGDPTSHDGKVLEGSLTDICHGKPIAYIGHKVSCPKCKGTFTIVEGVTTTTFYGKGVALAGMKTSCGAVLIATQFTDVVEVGTGGGASASASRSEGAKDSTGVASVMAASALVGAVAGATVAKSDSVKKITRLFWSYGEGESPVANKSRFYVDLNLHVETENYAAGEKVDVVIANDDGDDVATGMKTLAVQAIVGPDGTAKIKNVFAGKTVNITANA